MDYIKKIYICLTFVALFSSLFAFEPQKRFFTFDDIRLENNDIQLFSPGFSHQKVIAMKALQQAGLKAELEENIDTGIITIKFVLKNKYEIATPIRIDANDYLKTEFKTYFFNSFQEIALTNILEKKGDEEVGLIPEITLPRFAIPKAVKMITGNGAGRIRISGSQRIEVSMKREKKSGSGYSTLERQNAVSLDPKLNQELNLDISGTIGDKIFIEVHNKSNDQGMGLFEQNQVNLRYEGYDDEIIQSIEAGDTSFNLSGSKNVSLNTQGLFGVKTTLKLGNLEISAIASKEKTKKVTKTWDDKSTDKVIKNAYDYQKRTFYYIIPPEEFYVLEDGYEGAYSFLNNNKIQLDGDQLLINASQAGNLPLNDVIQVFVDDNNGNNNDETFLGIEDGNPDAVPQYFDEYIQGQDFEYYDGVIYFKKPIQKSYTIGITYTSVSGNSVGDVNADPMKLKIIKKYNEVGLEAQNVYSLGSNNINKDSFKLEIFKTRNGGVDEELNYETMSYNQLLGVVDSNEDYIFGTVIDLINGRLTLPLIHPFDTIEDTDIYSQETVPNIADIDMKIRIEGSSARDFIDLGFGIEPGSVVVRIDKREKVEGVDYIVDYDMGEIRILDSSVNDPATKLEIEYEQKQIFKIESKTLAGARFDWQPSDRLKLGSTIAYKNEIVSSDRPKIGNENRSLILADIDGNYELELPFLTTALDWLPLIKTDTDSKLTLSGEIALSNPSYFGSKDHPDIIYFDDMESVADIFSLGISQKTWKPASRPIGRYLRGKMEYFDNNRMFKNIDLFEEDTIPVDEKENYVSTLTLQIEPPTIQNPQASSNHWNGIMKYIGNEIDLSEKDYFEMMSYIEFADMTETDLDKVTIHVDMGLISEDFYDEGVNFGLLNSEDGLDGQSKDNILSAGEDVGLDMIKTGEPGDDPNDDVLADTNSNKVTINIGGKVDDFLLNSSRTEGNGDVPDTEDLNGNGILDTYNNYLEYSFKLNDTDFIESSKGDWVLMRVPLHNEEIKQNFNATASSNINLSKINYVRVWFEIDNSVDDIVYVSINSMDLVGNKWDNYGIKNLDDEYLSQEELLMNNENVEIQIVNNKKNPNYTAPKNSTTKTDGIEDQEQALVLKCRNIQPGHKAFLSQRYIDKVSLLDYRKILFWYYSEADVNNDAKIIFNVGADSSNYYSVKIPIVNAGYFGSLDNPGKMDKNSWVDMELELAEFTKLKNYDVDTTLVVGDKEYSIKGKPTLSNIRYVSFGLESGQREYSGNLYIDDIRVKDPRTDIGFAQQYEARLSGADIFTFSTNYSKKDHNFINNNSRTASRSNKTTESIKFTNSVNVEKFLNDDWGFKIPVTLQYDITKDENVYGTGSQSDVLIKDMTEEEKNRQKLSETTNKKISLNISKNNTKSWWLTKYTLNKMSVSGYLNKLDSDYPTSKKNTFSGNLKYNYNLALDKKYLGFGILKNYEFRYFPHSFENSIEYAFSNPQTQTWSLVDGVYQWKPGVDKKIQTLNTTNSIKYDMLSDLSLTYYLTTKRDLERDGFRKINVGDWIDSNINLGKETERSQKIGADYRPTFTEKVFSLSLSGNINYTQSENVVAATATSEERKYYNGSVDRRVSSDITLKNREFFTWLGDVFEIDPAPKIDNHILEDIKPEDVKDTQIDESRKQELIEKAKAIKKEMASNDLSDDKRAVLEKELESIKAEIGDNNSSSDIPKKTNEKDELLKRREELEKLLSEKLLSQSEKDSLNLEISQLTTTIEQIEENEKIPVSFGVKIFRFFSSVENIRLTYSNGYSTKFSRLDSLPDFTYQLGFENVLPNKSLSSFNRSNSIALNTGFDLTKYLNFSFNASRSTEEQVLSKTKSVTEVFPTLGVNILSLNELLKTGFERLNVDVNLDFIEKISANSSYSHSLKQTHIDGLKKSENLSINFSPLFKLDTVWVNDISTNLKTDYSLSRNTSFVGKDKVIVESVKRNYTGGIKYVFTAKNGFNIPFIGNRLRLKNKTTVNTNFSYETNYSEKVNTSNDSNADITANTSTFSISPSASYEFHKNITGSMNTKYMIVDDKKTDKKRTSFEFMLSATIKF